VQGCSTILTFMPHSDAKRLNPCAKTFLAVI
jgi:hypothetical protein